MTETEWLSCTDPTPMLEFLGNKVSDRKIRLFALACCYRIMHLLADKAGRQAVEVAERIAEGEPAGVNIEKFNDRVWHRGFQYIDGFRKEREVNVAYHAIFAAYNLLPNGIPSLPDVCTPFDYIIDVKPDLKNVPTEAAWAVAHHLRLTDEDEAKEEVFRQELAEQVLLLRDIFGPLPFRPATPDSSYLAWEDSAVVRLAQSIYQDRDFDLVPMLGDALEDAGCDNTGVLSHCRGSGPHVRGCWVLDSILGKL